MKIVLSCIVEFKDDIERMKKESKKDERLERILVSGKVQGVYFRVFSREKANDLNLQGYVRNLKSGDVEILVLASKEKLELFTKEIHKGPPASKVATLQRFTLNTEEEREKELLRFPKSKGFEIY